MASASSAHAALGGVRADARLVRRHSKPRRAATAGPPIVASASRRGAGSRAPGGSERARLATSSPSRGGPAPTARDPPRRGGRLVPRAARRDRVPVGDMKRALANAGVDTSACFERADLEAKFAMLTDAEKANVAEASAEATAGTAGSANANAKTSSSASSASGGGSSSSSSSKSSSSGASSDDDRKKKTSQKFTPRAIIDNILSAVRESANRADVRWGVGEKFREQTKGFVESAKRLDETIGVSRLAKNTLPPLWRTIQEFRRTPLGRVADVVFYVWLFLSGAFWTILTVGIAGAFVTNLLFPNFFRDRAAKAQEEAQRRFAEAHRAQGGMGGGYPGGMGGGYPGGAGGMGGGYPGGMGGMGGPGGGMGGQPGAGGRGAGTGGGGRKTYGGGGDGGAVVDVDADVKDV